MLSVVEVEHLETIMGLPVAAVPHTRSGCIAPADCRGTMTGMLRGA